MCLEFLKPDWIWWIRCNFIKHIQACSLSKFWILMSVLISCCQFYSVVMQRHRPIAHKISRDATAPPNCSHNSADVPVILWCKGTAQLLTDLANCCITRKLLWSVLVLFKPHRWLTCSPLYPRIWGDQVETLSWMKISSLLGARYLSRHL